MQCIKSLCRNWYDDKYNDTLLLALPRETRVSISSTLSVMRHSLQRICCFSSCRAGVCGFRSVIGSHALSQESTAHFHVCRPFNCLPLATSRSHLMEACLCYQQVASRMLWAPLGSVASSTCVERVGSPSLQRSW